MTLSDRFQQTIATIGFLGFMPYAPGTFGTAAAFLLILALKPGNLEIVIIFLPVFLLGILTSHTAEKKLGKDSGHIVIDEFSGYLIAVLFVPKSASFLFAAFVLFRIIDIVKPPPIRRMERLIAGGAGIMLDDVVAAVYTNLILQLVRIFFGSTCSPL